MENLTKNFSSDTPQLVLKGPGIDPEGKAEVVCSIAAIKDTLSLPGSSTSWYPNKASLVNLTFISWVLPVGISLSE